MTPQEKLKQQAAHAAVEWIENGMIVGLGTGSTVRFALEKIAEKIRTGELQHIAGIPSSEQTELRSRELGIPLTDFAAHTVIDVTIDGADEVDPQLNLIKGGGGALLREKVLAQASRKNVIIVDESKLSPALGCKWAVPIEVVPFAVDAVSNFLKSIGGTVALRQKPDGTPFFTDQLNLILDTDFGEITQPNELAAQLNNCAGVVEHGLFLNLTSAVIVAGASGIRTILRQIASDSSPKKFGNQPKIA